MTKKIIDRKSPRAILREEIKRIKYVISSSPMSEGMEKKMKEKLNNLEKELRQLKSGNKELDLGKE